MQGALRAWGFYVAGVLTVLLALWLYARRYTFEFEAKLEPDASARDDD